MISSISKTTLVLGLLCAQGLARVAVAQQPVPPPPSPSPSDTLVPPAEPPPPPPPPPPLPPPPALPPSPIPSDLPPESGDIPQTGDETPFPSGDESDKKKKKKKRKDSAGAGANGEEGSNVRSQYGIGDIRLGGWVFARADLQRLERTTVGSTGLPVTRDLNALDLSVPSARFRIDYQSPWPWLTGQIEVDLAGRPDMRDGYVQLKGENVAFRMGQFKMPVLALQMESPWVLPLVRRGLIHDLTVDWLDVAGRRPGAMFTFREKFGQIKTRLFLGAFQASSFVEIDANGTRDTDLVRERSLYAQNLVARGQVDVGSVEIGSSYEYRRGSPTFGVLRPLWTAGADVTVNHVFAAGGLRLWADGLVGASWYEHPSKPVDMENATFVAARLLVAYRFGGVVPEAIYVEPYLFGGVFDPDVDVTSDLAWEATAGVNVGFWGRARATLQAEMDEGQRNFPIGYLAGVSPDRLALIGQLGLAY